jgi:hypothetical protein
LTVVNFLIQFSVCYIQPVNQIRPIIQSIFLSFWNTLLLHLILFAFDVFFWSARLWLIQIVLQSFFLVGHRSTISIICSSKLLVDLYRNKLLIFRWAWWSWIMRSNLNITLHRLAIQFTDFPFVHFVQIDVI